MVNFLRTCVRFLPLFAIIWPPFAMAEDEKAPAPEKVFSIPVGSPEVDVSRLQPYRAIWVRNIKNGEEWGANGTAEEILSVDQTGQWLHTQIMRPFGSDQVSTSRRLFEQSTFSPLHFIRTLENGPEAAPLEIEFDIRPYAIIGEYRYADGTLTPYTKTLSEPMFDGLLAGLVIAALPLEEGYTETLPTAIPTLNATYWLEITVTGKLPYTVMTGEVIEVWEVTANWYNYDDGDWYPPGRDDWGGAYYIAEEPGNGVPYVVEYAHSTLIFAWDGVRRPVSQ